VDRLGTLATFPELRAWERGHGSLIRGSQAARRAAGRAEPGPMFVKLRGGTATLTDRLAEALRGSGAELRLGERAAQVRASGPRFAVEIDGTSSALEADLVVVATPAFAAADLLGDLAPPVAADLSGIPYASTGVVFLVYAEGTQRALPDGTGFVVPRGLAPMTACTWLSNKWPRPEYGTRAVVRCYVGSAGDDEIVDAADEDLVAACQTHLAALVQLPARAAHTGVVRWHRAMPQYEVGHLERTARIRSGLPAGIFVTGSALDGVGIPDIVRAAGETATEALAHLSGARETAEETI
jgi:oxygen-dependent protoporphyrinogen oxidase